MSTIPQTTVVANITVPRWPEITCAHLLGSTELATIQTQKKWYLTRNNIVRTFNHQFYTIVEEIHVLLYEKK